MTSPPFSQWFRANAGFAPHPWQAALAEHPHCEDRLIRIPTGMGKTLGVLAAWSYHRLVLGDPLWPRRLVLCLPMRVLVEQTQATVQAWLDTLGKLWAEGSDTPAADEVGVHLLLGGATTRAWHLYPEREAILVGTQDMLLSRALNRGYGSPRGRWPMEQALLRQDSLWVLDEVQLMDVGLRTSVQLQAFYDQASSTHEEKPLTQPARSWWMSATLQPSWLGSVDFAGALPGLRDDMLTVPSEERRGPLFEANKPVRVETIPAKDDRKARAWAQTVLEAHRATPVQTRGRLTLAIANTVGDATALFDALAKAIAKSTGKGEKSTELRLVHSRFRGRERACWREAFLNREACSSGADRIIVATQVVEAGVDISADTLVTALAPWPSLVQRFGRAARYGGSASIIVIDRALPEGAAAPYEAQALAAALEVLGRGDDVGLGSLERLEEGLAAQDPALLERLYPYAPLHTITREEHADLFDTGPDLTGSDLDVSRFIRSGEDRDLQVWWWPIADDTPGADLQPMRDALCPAPVIDARTWLTKGKSATTPRAWLWSYLDGAWRRVQRAADLYPGQLILVDAADGGYLEDRGFVGGQSRTEVPCEAADRRAASTLAARLHHADNAQDHEDLSALEEYKSIAFHGLEAGEEADRLATSMALDQPLADLLGLAARVHDLGKAHAVFQGAIVDRAEPHQHAKDLAKAPRTAWRRGRGGYTRPGFRHELASTLGLLESLYQAAPLHPGLLGEHQEFVDRGLLQADRDHLAKAHPRPEGLVAELATLDADELNLVLYLVCAHHGKVRGSWQATPQDQEAQLDPERGSPLRGVLEGDPLPPTRLADAAGEAVLLPGVDLHLDPAALGLSARYGASWRERVDRLRRRYGDGALVLLETLLRVADVRASMRRTSDPWIGEERDQ